MPEGSNAAFAALTVVLGLALGGALPAAEVAPGIELLRGAYVAGTQPDGNSVILRGPEGLVVVDTGRHPEHTARIAARARSLGLPVRAIVNTHWHLDHVGGNAALRREFPAATVVASDAIHGALTGFLADYRRQLETMAAQAASEEAARPFRAELALLDAAPALLPDQVVMETGRRVLAGREVEIHLEAYAVTAGDLWLFDRATRTLIAGDLVTLPAPFLDTACPQRWRNALGRLAAVDFALLVPGHGAPMDRTAFARYRAAFVALLACAASDAAAASCVDGWLAAAGDLIPETERRLARGLVDYYVGQILRGDAGKRAALCGETEMR